MVKRTTRRRSIANPYVRALSASTNRWDKIRAYETARENFKLAQTDFADYPRTWLAKSKVSGYGAYGGSMFTGHGGYKNQLRKIMRSKAIKHVGRGLISKGVEGFDNAMRGSGAYTSNSLVTTGGITDQVPSFSSAGDETGALTITHREYVTDIYGLATNGFNVQAYALNPGLESTFPWLSQLAVNYEEYEMIQCMFTYRSTTTDIGSSTSGQCGTMIMVTNYNAAAPPFSDKVSMMEYDSAMSVKVTENMVHGVECDSDKLSSATGKYIRAGPVPVGQDAKTYDHGLFQFALANTPQAYTNQTLGELWVSYTVKLRKPRFFTNRGLNINQDIFAASGPISVTQPMGAPGSLLKGQQNNIGCALQVPASGAPILLIPAAFAGQIRVTYRFTGVGLGSVGNTYFAAAGNVFAWADMYGTTATGASAFQTAIGTYAGCVTFDFRVAVATGGVTNQLTLPTISATSISAASLEVTELNGSFSTSNSNAANTMINTQGTVVVV